MSWIGSSSSVWTCQAFPCAKITGLFFGNCSCTSVVNLFVCFRMRSLWMIDFFLWQAILLLFWSFFFKWSGVSLVRVVGDWAGSLNFQWTLPFTWGMSFRLTSWFGHLAEWIDADKEISGQLDEETHWVACNGWFRNEGVLFIKNRCINNINRCCSTRRRACDQCCTFPIS